MKKRNLRAINGVLLLDKAENVSSNRALQSVRFLYGAAKAGHTGTLDPFATGLLPVCFGEANKYARWLIDSDKSYAFTAVLGKYSDTGDSTGQLHAVQPAKAYRPSELEAVSQQFLGEIEQIPPKFSALHINGQRAYDLARAGVDFEIPSRLVRVHQLRLVQNADLTLSGFAKVSKGTYIRTLVEDIAKALGTVAYCAHLRRLSISPFLANAICDERLQNALPQMSQAAFTLPQMHTEASLKTLSDAERQALLLPVDSLCAQFATLSVSAEEVARLQQGKRIRCSLAADFYRLYFAEQFIGLGQSDGEGLMHPFRMMQTA